MIEVAEPHTSFDQYSRCGSSEVAARGTSELFWGWRCKVKDSFAIYSADGVRFEIACRSSSGTGVGRRMSERLEKDTVDGGTRFEGRPIAVGLVAAETLRHYRDRWTEVVETSGSGSRCLTSECDPAHSSFIPLRVICIRPECSALIGPSCQPSDEQPAHRHGGPNDRALSYGGKTGGHVASSLTRSWWIVCRSFSAPDVPALHSSSALVASNSVSPSRISNCHGDGQRPLNPKLNDRGSFSLSGGLKVGA